MEMIFCLCCVPNSCSQSYTEHVLMLLQTLMSVPLRTEDASVIVPTQWAASSAAVLVGMLYNQMD